MPEMTVLRSIPFIVALWAGIMLATFGSVSAAEWRVEKISGDVRVHGASEKWIPAKPGQILNSGDSVWTGQASRAQLATDDGTVLLKPRTLVKIPSRRLARGMTVLYQAKGEITAKVRKKKSNHFSVETPFLAAVVKGTEFTIEIKSDHSRLSVKSGIVGATDTSTGESIDVTAGQSITVSKASDSATKSYSSDHSGDNPDEDENLGNDDDPVSGRDKNKHGGRAYGKNGGGRGQHGGGNHCGGNCGNGQGNGGGNGTDNEGNGNENQ